jgi:hypothetical protein
MFPAGALRLCGLHGKAPHLDESSGFVPLFSYNFARRGVKHGDGQLP